MLGLKNKLSLMVLVVGLVGSVVADTGMQSVGINSPDNPCGTPIASNTICVCNYTYDKTLYFELTNVHIKDYAPPRECKYWPPKLNHKLAASQIETHIYLDNTQLFYRTVNTGHAVDVFPTGTRAQSCLPSWYDKGWHYACIVRS